MFFLGTIGLYSQADDILDKDEWLLQDDFSKLEIEEWKRFKYFESQLKISVAPQNQKDIELKSYAKDSLKILKVKLFAFRILESKNLLEHDIAENPDYYLAFLRKLKESDLKRSEYLFLENKLAFLTTQVAEQKYGTSRIINVLLGLVVAGMVFFVSRLLHRKNQHVIVDLSKQEKNVQGLILQGKSNKQIASELFISLSTVKTHITNIYGKLQVSSRQELLQKTQNS